MNYKNAVFLGTSHIAKQSLEEVKRSIEEIKPDIVALELDKARLIALMDHSKRKVDIRSIRRIGLKGFIFSLFGAWAEKKLGKLVGVAPGSEMKQAVKIARKDNIRIALVDQDIQITLRRLSKSITWKEKRNFLADILKAVFLRKKEIDFDLTKVPDKELIKKLTGRVKRRYPGVYRALIDERNKVIAQNVKKLMDSNPGKSILVIIGAGHVDEVVELIKKSDADGGGNIRYSLSIG